MVSQVNPGRPHRPGLLRQLNIIAAPALPSRGFDAAAVGMIISYMFLGPHLGRCRGSRPHA